jgi:hypothetical protein
MLYKTGSIRYKDEKGEWVIVQPGDPMFGLSLFLATEYLTEKGWVKINVT